VELYESDLFHDLPFLALGARPPPMYSLLVNGDPAGSILRIDSEADAAVMDRTLMAFPYRLICPRPSVLLIGETGGTNVWLARRQDAARIDVVQPNAAVLSLWREWSFPLMNDPRVHCHPVDPRAFLRSARNMATLCVAMAPGTTPAKLELCATQRDGYDLIQIAALEGLGGTGGVRGLAEDHLVTVEGLADALRALSDDGVLAVCRGLQEPERENIRLLATLVEALESLGVADPSRQVIQVRDYLGVCTMALKTPLTDARRQTLRAAIRNLNLTPVWYDGLPAEEVNRPDALDGPPGTQVDWLHHAARQILSPRRGEFYAGWLLDVRPARDDRPFFWDFYKPQAVAALWQAYGELWVTRAELGRLFLYASLVIAALAAVVLILLPLGVVELRRYLADRVAQSSSFALLRVAQSSSFALLYFAGIGLGFMGIEMALISRATCWLGDPVIASAAVIGGVLVASGLGSLTGPRLVGRRIWLAPAVVAIAAGLVRMVAWKAVSPGPTSPWPLLLCAVPAAYVMGLPLPVGISALNQLRPRLVAWAWGVNGVASVLATSTAILVAMLAGYRMVMVLAAAAYVSAAAAGAGWRLGEGRVEPRH
jgi:hypothetical protein